MPVTTPSGTSRPSWAPNTNSRIRDSRPIRAASPTECSWICRVASARAASGSEASASVSMVRVRDLRGRYRDTGVLPIHRDCRGGGLLGGRFGKRAHLSGQRRVLLKQPNLNVGDLLPVF